MEKNDASHSPETWRHTIANERVAHMVKDAYKSLSRALQVRLRQHSVLYGHWTFLRILWQTDGLTQRQLSEQAGVMEPTTFSAVQAMEQLGYVTRRKIPPNRKQIRVFLTPKGTALRNLLVPAAEEVNRIALAGIPADDIAATRRTLLAIMENLAVSEAAAAAASQLPDTPQE
ncbi:MarR family transcriptional regulator [Pigmentiphaga sp. NML080357]|uniref:MarR family winged helix-turn-helix transcriptional regulator n=1 Tax=Pigmentiphaga sp. NML080357 TaxID=2008675 RepID=UPI000B40FE86|nr:MarR family winged helix-turn-helix transcriptional regulator [Pigmentiphaga sp. NML080357]OVZ61259.1 MarR family transcriptional regulator [Pigmentiphaga sp. NML080357]